MLQATLKALEGLKSLLDIIRSVPTQYVTCGCLFQRCDDERNSVFFIVKKGTLHIFER